MLSHRFDDALAFAATTHRSQIRKGSGIPYIAHLMSVSALTLEYGGDEDCAIAGLLHDSVEDQGGMDMARIIADRFGHRVRDIVIECSDSTDQTKAPWRDRKTRYLHQIKSKSDAAILVTSCDKLHNASTILQDMETMGPAIFDRFTGKRDGTLWYYRNLVTALAPRTPGSLHARLNRTVTAMEELATASGAG
jgi:(p)ppGpp synthase/HD superfamily hydrolase